MPKMLFTCGIRILSVTVVILVKLQLEYVNFADHLRIQPIVIGVPGRPAGILQIEPDLE